MNRILLATLFAIACLTTPPTAHAEYVDGMSLYRGYFVPGGVAPFGLTCDSSALAFSFMWHYAFGGKKQFPGAGNRTYGACALRLDEGVRQAARAELLSMVGQLCKKSTQGTKRVWGKLRPQPKDFNLLHTTNVPSRGFNLDMTYKSTVNKCCCRIDWDVKYFWQDRADLHFWRNGQLLFPDWIASLFPVSLTGGGPYEINIWWQKSATYQEPFGRFNTTCKRIRRGWPLEKERRPRREGPYEGVPPEVQ